MSRLSECDLLRSPAYRRTDENELHSDTCISKQHVLSLKGFEWIFKKLFKPLKLDNTFLEHAFFFIWKWYSSWQWACCTLYSQQSLEIPLNLENVFVINLVFLMQGDFIEIGFGLLEFILCTLSLTTLWAAVTNAVHQMESVKEHGMIC